MKKIYLLALVLFFSLSSFADFVEKRFKEQQISIEEVVLHFNEWFGTGDSEFRLFFDETDELGMRDQDYQQYINGIKIENSALYIHSCEGYVSLINGDIMPQNKAPKLSSNISPKRAIKIATGIDTTSISPQKTIIHKLNKTGGFDYFTVYEVTTLNEVIYVDCSTGEIIQSLPLFSNSKACSIETRYNGAQSITCETNSDGNLILHNDDKNLRTLYAYLDANSNLPADRYNFTNSSTNWSGNYLTTVVINAVHNESWWNPYMGDSYPDLYIRITNASGNLIYVSDYKEDCGLETLFPVTFRIPEMVKIPSNGGYKIEIWDEDLGDDTKGSTITLTSNANGSYTWGSSSLNTEGYFIINQWHPALDVQWGLEKTWDFYNSEFNHQGFDGNNALTRAILHSPISVSNIAVEINNLSITNNEPNINNAFAHSPQDVSGAYIHFGIGNERGESMVDLNCVSHEFTHLVTAYRPKGILANEGESGALNEGYSDAMAVAVEAKLKGSINWLYGHGVQSVGYDNKIYDYCRNIANPKAGGPEGPKPDTYGKGPWVDPTNTSKENDHGGVHMNNSIFTHWFYILCEGKTGVNDNQQSYSVSPIGLDKALKIIWRMHRTYLPQQATFAQARKWAIQSAQDIYPNKKDILKAVTDAWYAVGVGEKYVDDPAQPKEISCTEAVKIASELSHNTPTDETYTVIGYVTDTDGKISKNQQIFWMADTKNGGKVFESYWGNVSEAMKVGDKVSVTGHLMRYNSTSEIKNGSVVLLERASQSIDQVTNDQMRKCENAKIIRNGQIVILRGEKVYTTTGQEVR